VRFQPFSAELILARLDDDRKRGYDVFVSGSAIMDPNGDPAPSSRLMTSLRSHFHLRRRSARLKHCLRRELKMKPEVSSLFCSQNQFGYDEAKRALPREECQKDVVPILYRPFDRTWTVYSR
jgi:hypothetical protein